MSDRAKADFKEKLAGLIAEMQRRELLTRPPDYLGDGSGGILEHNVRKYFFNELLPSLGCCQACAYQPLCWEDELEGSLPCGTILL